MIAGALGRDVIIMGTILAMIALAMLLVTLRRSSEGWTRAARVGVIVVVIGGLAAWQYLRKQEKDFREASARDAIALISVEKQVDAVSMFEDIVRIHFRFQNRSRRAVETFSASFQVEDGELGKMIEDHLSIPVALEPGATGTWSVKYWASCPQQFTTQEWEMLVARDLSDFDVQWTPEALIFRDGQTLR